jgi:hypothetical protein
MTTPICSACGRVADIGVTPVSLKGHAGREKYLCWDCFDHGSEGAVARTGSPDAGPPV